jgi:hypothetical protein
MSHVPMTAPVATSNFSSKKKNDNLQLVPMGMHPAIIYAIVNVGTHAGEWQGKPNMSNKLKIMVEFPMHKQLFWEEDTELTPSSLIMDFSYSVSKNKKTGKKSKLLEVIESLYGPLQESQFNTFDIGQMLNLKIFANVIHYTKQDGTVGAKIASMAPFNPMMINPDSIQQTNKSMLYAVQMGFECQAFAELIFFFRKSIKESEEGKEHIAKGGRFVKLDENGVMIIDDGTSDYVSAPVGKLIMTNPQLSYESMKGAGWTDDAMIEHGYARREAVVSIPTPTIAPTPAPIQQAIPQAAAPMSIQPQMPLASSNPTAALLTMIDLSAPYQAFIANGWTDELLIQHGKALRMTPAAEAFPTAPSVPVAAPPMAQAIPQAVIPQAMSPVAVAQPMGVPVPQPSAAALFTQTTAAPVQNIAVPMPMAPVSTFEQAPAPTTFAGQEQLDDLPF